MSLTISAGVTVERFDLDVDVDVASGEVLAVLGPNGSGKSTLLRLIAGLIAADRGHIALDRTVLDDPSTDVFVAPENRPVGVVFQHHLLFPHMSALENVAFGLRARGAGRREARQAAHDWLQRVGLDDRAEARPRKLSGGQAQRIALARALATDPAVLLLDEPLAALDAGARQDTRRELRRHLSSFDGVRLLVTHDPVDVYALADRVAVLEHGRIVQTGTIREVTAHPRSRYVADLVGTNLISGTVSGGVLETVDGVSVVVTDAPAGPAFAVIRPQAITLTRHAAPASSARNAWAGTVDEIDRLGERVRVGIVGSVPLTAEISVGALDALALRPGDDVHAAVKATDIQVYPV